MRNNLLIDQFDLLAEADSFVKFSQNLILQLAVRGKLVEQDPSDPPASVLIEEIRRTKGKLLKDAKQKIEKSLSPIKSSEIPYSVPNFWEWIKLGEVGMIVGGGTPKTSNKEFFGAKGIPWLTPADLYGYKEKYISKGRRFITDSGLNNSSAQLMPAGTVLFSSRAPIGYVAISKVSISTNQGFKSCVPYLRECSEFIYYYLMAIAPEIDRNAPGTTFREVSGKIVKNINFPLPPLSEQKRIVAKVEKLFPLCDQLEKKKRQKKEIRGKLNKVCLDKLLKSEGPEEFGANWKRIVQNFDLLYSEPENVQELRQAILQLAVQGKLVPQDPNDLPAPRKGKWFVYVLECEGGSLYKGHSRDVLARWKQHAVGQGAEWTKKHPPIRLVHWEEFDSEQEAVAREKDLKTGYGRKWLEREIKAGRTRQAGEPASILLQKIQKEKEKLIKEGKLKKEKPLPPIDASETPFPLPQGWEWERLGRVIWDLKYGTSKKCFRDKNGVPVLRIPNLKNGRISTDDLKYAEFTVKETEGLQLSPGNLLLIRSNGSKSLVGRSAIVGEGERGFAYAGYLVRLRISEKYIFPTYLHLALESKEVRSQIEGPIRTTSGVKNINSKEIGNLRFALPPIREQKRIVAKVDQLMALCDQLEAKLKESQSHAEKLLRATIHQLVGGGI